MPPRPPASTSASPSRRVAAAGHSTTAGAATARRSVSSLPGPLEARRRTGRRHMTDLHVALPSAGGLALPPWALPQALLNQPADLSRWTWEAPTAPRGGATRTQREAMRGQQQQQQQVGGGRRRQARGGDSGLRALAEGESDPAREAALDEAAQMPRWLQTLLEVDPDELRLHQAAKRRREARGGQEAPSHLDCLPSFLKALQSDGSDDGAQAVHRYLGALRKDLELGLVAAGDAAAIFEQSLDAIRTRDQAGPRPEVSALTTELCAALVQGIHACRIMGASSFPASMWNALLVALSRLRPSDKTYDLARTTMDMMPSEYYHSIKAGTRDMLSKLFSLLSSQCSNEEVKTFNLRIRRLLQPLQTKTLDECRPILDIALQVLLSDRLSQLNRSRTMRYSWLTTLSTLRPVDQEYLMQTCTRLFPDNDMANTKVCRILATHWSTRGRLRQDSIRQLLKAACDPAKSPTDQTLRRQSLARLCTAVVTSQPHESRGPLLQSLCDWLTATGSEESIIASFHDVAEVATAAESETHATLEALKMVSRLLERNGKDLDMAKPCKRLAELVERRKHIEDSVMSMTMDPAISLREVWETITGCEYSAANRLSRHGPARDDDIRPKMDMLAAAVARAPHLTNRQALRFLEMCYRHHVANSREPATPVLARSILHVLLKGSDGPWSDPASWRRATWFVRVLRLQHGNEVADLVRPHLEELLELRAASKQAVSL